MSNAALLSNATNQHFTPFEIINSVETVFESKINLDPASCAEANSYIGADQIYTVEDNGLEQQWKGKIFLNPPSAQKGSAWKTIEWFQKLVNEYYAGRITEAVYLGFSIEQLSKDVQFFDFPMCVTNKIATSSCISGSGRIKFLMSDLKPSSSPTHMNFFTYLPPIRDIDKRKTKLFLEEFRKYGVTFLCVR